MVHHAGNGAAVSGSSCYAFEALYFGARFFSTNSFAAPSLSPAFFASSRAEASSFDQRQSKFPPVLPHRRMLPDCLIWSHRLADEMDQRLTGVDKEFKQTLEQSHTLLLAFGIGIEVPWLVRKHVSPFLRLLCYLAWMYIPVDLPCGCSHGNSQIV